MHRPNLILCRQVSNSHRVNLSPHLIISLLQQRKWGPLTTWIPFSGVSSPLHKRERHHVAGNPLYASHFRHSIRYLISVPIRKQSPYSATRIEKKKKVEVMHPCRGAVVLRCRGTVVPWCGGAVVQWYRDVLPPWYPDAVLWYWCEVRFFVSLFCFYSDERLILICINRTDRTVRFSEKMIGSRKKVTNAGNMQENDNQDIDGFYLVGFYKSFCDRFFLSDGCDGNTCRDIRCDEVFFIRNFFEIGAN